MWNIGPEIVALVASSYGLVRYLSRDKIRYDRTRDYEYGLQADWSCACELDSEVLVPRATPPADQTLVLAIRLKTGPFGRLFEPGVSVLAEGRKLLYHFEPGASGVRYIDVSALAPELSEGKPVYLHTSHCRADPLEMSGYSRPPLETMRLMILAPHPDDAEIAAYGVYERHAKRTSIVTVSPGEHMARLKRQYIPELDDSLPAAVRRKGEIRAWDAHCVPRWAGVQPDDTVMLGYLNSILAEMRNNPEEAIEHPVAPDLNPDDFRRFNTLSLPTDGKATNRWTCLVDDLTALIERKRPDAVFTPHPEIDIHPDHVVSTHALEEAMARSSHQVRHVFYYVNHIRGTRNHPYGPEHGSAGLPPHFSVLQSPQRVFSFALDAEQQRRKVCALYLMHDLVSPVRPLKHLRRQWRHFLRWGRRSYYGPDTYFRTAVRANELFFYRSRTPGSDDA